MVPAKAVPHTQGAETLASVVTVNPTIDSSSYLTNPGMGWQHTPGIGTQLLAETVDYPNRSDVSWKLINTADNTYNWSILDTKINAAKAKGNQIGFRVYSMRGEDYGGHQVPQWAVDQGVPIESNGEPNYDSCTYQDLWAKFVEAMRVRYDGNPDIAFIDVSGYGDFNEWSYLNRTQWDDAWASAYGNGTASATTMEQLDSKTRRRLADTFIGGSIASHQCKNSSGQVVNVSYSYPGFQSTQLVMPYAGVRQTTQYVYLRRKDVGFRHDCLGRTIATDMMNKVGPEINGLWKTAPIIYEYCAYDVSLANSAPLLQASHASLVHDNLTGSNRQQATVETIMKFAGYRYALQEASLANEASAGGNLLVLMTWRNYGYAANYPKMGQDFQPYLYIMSGSEVKHAEPVAADTSKWYPANTLPGTPPDYNVAAEIEIPANLAAGSYSLKYAIVDERTNKAINLAHPNRDSAGRYPLADIQILSGTEPVLTTPNISPNSASYTNSVQVTMSTTEPGTTIRYTTNGTNPTTSSTQYSGPFTLTASRTIKARAYKTGYASSPISTRTYTITTNNNGGGDNDGGPSETFAPVYRFLQKRLKIHFYTANVSERDFVKTNLVNDWQLEGAGYSVPTSANGTIPVYRFLHKQLKIHFYTASEAEKNFVINNLSSAWQFEGIGFRAYASDGLDRKPVHRFLHRELKIHFYTGDANEKIFVETQLGHIWQYEGIAYYGK